MQLLENNLVKLRAPEPEDLEILYRWENDTRLWQVSNAIEPVSRYQIKQFIENSSQGIYALKQARFMIELASKAHMVAGAIDLFDYDPYHARAGIGIVVEEQFRNQGIASAALELIVRYSFGHLKLKQLYCNILQGNEASIRLFEHQGFQLAGIKKQWIRGNNGFVDEMLFQRINPDF